VAEIGIGSTVWVFDHNYRTYDDNRKLIYRDHWRPTEITGETRASWITRYGKVPKKADDRGRRLVSQGGYSPLRAALTAAEVEDDIWTSSHAHKIADQVRHCDAATLRKIAELIGYEPTEANP
jgi:hypothetical protein